MPDLCRLCGEHPEEVVDLPGGIPTFVCPRVPATVGPVILSDLPPVRMGQRVRSGDLLPTSTEHRWPSAPIVGEAAREWLRERRGGVVRQADDGERGAEWARAHGPDATTKREAADVQCPRCGEHVPAREVAAHGAVHRTLDIEEDPHENVGGPPLSAWQVRRAIADAPYVGPVDG